MKPPLVSIIVPVYNVAEYLPKCLDSLVNQTLTDIEIILVNDCSPDPEDDQICQDCASKDQRIKYIRHEQNTGVGGARNTGIQNAHAEYIGWVDSDDWVEPDMFEKLYKALTTKKACISQCYFMEHKPDGIKYRKLRQYRKQRDILNSLNVLLWNKLFKKSLFTDHGISFPEHLSLDDMATMPRLLYYVDKVTLVKEPLYHYRANRQGALTANFDKIFQDHIEEFRIIKDFLVGKGKWRTDRLFFEKRIIKSLHHDVGRQTCDVYFKDDAKNKIISNHLDQSLTFLQFPERIKRSSIEATYRSLSKYKFNLQLKLILHRWSTFGS